MYKNYKSSLTQSKKPSLSKGQQKQQQAKNTTVEKVTKPKPDWNDAVKEESSYKLSASEMVQRKISLMSKHRLEAKEEWLERQEKLRKGVIDDETKRIYDTARQSKNLPSKEDEIQRKNLSQMLNFIPKPQRDPKAVVDNVKQNLQDTRKFIEVMEQYQNNDDPNRVLRVMDRLRNDQTSKQNSQSTLYSQKGLDSMRKSTRSISNQNIKCSIQNEQRYSDKKKSENENENDIFSSSQKENSQEMANYFTSLDKIQETIKFMEDKIIGERKSPKKQNIPPSSIVEKKLFNEIKEITEFDQTNLKNNNNLYSLKEQTYFQDDYEDQTFDKLNFKGKNNKLQSKPIENLIDMRVGSSMNASKQINTSRSKLDIDQCSFNLTDGEDESSINHFGNTLQNSKNRATRSRSQSFEKRIIDSYEKNVYQNTKDNDLVVKDVKCNIDTIDPNMFFDNSENEDDYQYEYTNQSKKTSTNIKLSNDDTLKSDYQKTYENTLYKNNNQDTQQVHIQKQDVNLQKQQNQQKSSLQENYDLIAERKLQELCSQVNTIKLQTNANDIFSRLKQQTEDDSDQFYANRIIPQQNNFMKQQPMNDYSYPPKQTSKPQNNYKYQEKQNEPEEEEDYLSRNIDQLREMLEATKKDLQKLETNESNEINNFSQQQSQNLMDSAFQGKKMQNKIPIITNNEYNQYQETIKKNNITIIEKPQQKELNKPSNPPFINQFQQLQNNVDDGMFINNEPYKNESNAFFQSNSQSQNYFTSNLFLANNNSTNNQQQSYGKNPFNY